MSMYNIALSGVNANRTALNVTAQNVANANTEGYSRQQVMQSSVVDTAGVGGVEISSIRRVADEFIISQLRSSNTALGNSSYSAESLGQLEQIIGFDGFNISTGISEFFAGISEATSAPESTALRQQVLADAQSLSERFNGLSNALLDQSAQIFSDRETTLSNANGLLENIATSSQAIIESNASGRDTALLEDERDQMLSELSKMLKVNVNKEADGSLQVSRANGQPLLINSLAAKLTTTPLISDPYQADIEVTFNGSVFPVATDLGGELGAMQTSQQNDISPMLSALNDMAETIADEVNNALATGTDFNGVNPGQALFSYEPNNLTVIALSANELAFSSDGNLGDGGVLDDILAISKTDYPISGLGSVTLSSAFSALTGKVAMDSRQAQTSLESHKGLFDQIQSSRDSVSAVNSDEEAANLMIYANAYEANMKVISTANQMFNTLLSAF